MRVRGGLNEMVPKRSAQGLAQSDGQMLMLQSWAQDRSPETGPFSPNSPDAHLPSLYPPDTNVLQLFNILAYSWYKKFTSSSPFCLKFQHAPRGEPLFENHWVFCIFLPAKEMLPSIGLLSVVSIIKNIHTRIYLYLNDIITISII